MQERTICRWHLKTKLVKDRKEGNLTGKAGRAFHQSPLKFSDQLTMERIPVQSPRLTVRQPTQRQYGSHMQIFKIKMFKTAKNCAQDLDRHGVRVES